MINGFYKLIDKIINSFTEQGFTQVSYGDENDLDLTKRQSNYPLAHIIFDGMSNTEKDTTLNFILIIADKVDKTPNDNIKYGQNNNIDIQQSLIVKGQSALLAIGRNEGDYDDQPNYYMLGDVKNWQVFREDYPEILSGFIISFEVTVPSMDDLC